MTLEQFYEVTKDMPKNTEMFIDIGLMIPFWVDIFDVFFDKELNKIKIC